MEALSGAGQAADQRVGQALVRPRWDAACAQNRQRQFDRATSRLLPSELPGVPKR